jgi:aspartokinase
MISTSEIKISVVIELAKGKQAIKAVHDAFLEQSA